MENKIQDIHEVVYAHLLEKYPELRFTLRQIDRGGRLSNGYWFTGNDNYISFSFWNGTDWRNKTSNIFFSIDKDGTCWLNFIANEDDSNGLKNQFLGEVAELIGMRKRPRRKDDPTKQDWFKQYQGKNYIASLDNFIKGDKKIIDAFALTKAPNIFSLIDEQKFNEWKEHIEKERQNIKYKPKKDIDEPKKELNQKVLLRFLSLENISLFKKKESIFFHERLTCIVGLNGLGKTSLLRAIVLGFTGYEQDESLTVVNGKLIELQRLLRITGESQTIKGEAQYVSSGSIVLNYSVDKTGYANQVLFTIEDNKPVIRDGGAFKSIKDKNYICLFLAFPQEQGAKNGQNTEGGILPNLEDTKAMLYREADSRFQRFATWLRKINNISNDKKARGESNQKEQQLLHKAFEVINKIAGEDVRLHKIIVKDGIEDPIWVKLGKNAEPILLDLISQGYNNIFGWTGYLITRLSEVAEAYGIEDFMTISAIVLIDEIDTYLHPSWQSKILMALVEMFPNIQFVVTTHSPYVVGSIPKDLMRLYICGDSLEEFDDFSPYGANIERLTRQIFKTPVRPAEGISEKVENLRKAIQQNEIEKADTILKDLEILGIADDDNDPEIGSLKIFLRTKKRKANA